MIYTAIDTFYLTDEELENSPSRKDGIDAATETTLRIYGCDLIQESGILLRMPQAVMATGQVLFHRFHSKKSFARFHVKKVAACCLWLASKLEECPKKARQVIMVFHRMECRRENLPIEHLDPLSKEYSDLKAELSRTERYILKEMGVICHVEHSWLGLACVFLFTIQWAAGFFTYWYPGGSKNSRANLMPWHVFFGVYIYALAVVTVTTGILEKATFLQANHVISRYSTEALLINSLGILVVALGGFVILAVISPANKGDTFRESIE